MDFNEIKKAIKEEWAFNNKGKEYDVFFHNTSVSDLSKKKFVYREDSKNTGVKGLFAHMGDEDYDYFRREYGHLLMAVVVERSAKPAIRPVDDVDNSNKEEAFISELDVRAIDMVSDYV